MISDIDNKTIIEMGKVEPKIVLSKEEVNELLRSRNDTQPIKLGDIIFTKDPTKYNLLGIGTCVIIYLYDLKESNYMIAHTVLPYFKEYNLSLNNNTPGKFADVAVNLMIKTMLNKGSLKKNLRVKLVGGGQIFNDHMKIGARNIEATRAFFQEHKIEISAEDLGGDSGRSILAFEPDGSLIIRKKTKLFKI